MVEGLAGQVAIVTGAADGLGRATSRAMAAKGMRVLLVDIDEQRLAETEALIRDAGGEAAVFRADVSDAPQVRGYVAKAISRFGRIDAFFNNAGILGVVEPISRLSDRHFRQGHRSESAWRVPGPALRAAGHDRTTRRIDHPHRLNGLGRRSSGQQRVQRSQTRRDRSHEDGRDRGGTDRRARERRAAGQYPNQNDGGDSSAPAPTMPRTSDSPPGWPRRGGWARRRKSLTPCASSPRMLPRTSPASSCPSMAAFSPRPTARPTRRPSRRES